MKKTAIILIAMLLCVAMSSLGVGKVKTAAPKPSNSGVDTVTSATPNTYRNRNLPESYLKSLPLSGGYYSCLKGSSPYTYFWQDWYGVSLAYLLNEEVGLADGTTGIRLYAADGATVDLPIDRVLNPNTQGLPTILAWENNTTLIGTGPNYVDDPSNLTPLVPYAPPVPPSTKATGEGPFRLAFGQSPVGDHSVPGEANFQSFLKWVRAIEVEPLPAGMFPVTAANTDNGHVLVYGNIQPFSISNLETTSTASGTEVTIKGYGFYGTQGTSYVSFGATQATVYDYWSCKQIKCMVPAGVSGTVDLTVTTSEGTCAAVPITISPPAVSGVNPATGPVGTEVTISGTNFHTQRGTATVSFGATPAAVSDYVSWNDSEIKCKVPAGVTGTVNITVTTSEGTSNAVPFTVANVAPTVTSVNPTYGVQGWAVVSISDLAGTGFKAGAGVSLVKGSKVINATDVNVVSDTKITCNFSLASNPDFGKYDVVVTNPDTLSGKLAQGFSITNACGGGATISVAAVGLVMGLLSIAGLGGVTRRRRRIKK